ncbi:hypothetical protein GF376_04620 [Candidatus Peregrinibacteria bacterium]|nr:hypothetical protein [Candidatus Peregrinibacteria bacterium]
MKKTIFSVSLMIVLSLSFSGCQSEDHYQFERKLGESVLESIQDDQTTATVEIDDQVIEVEASEDGLIRITDDEGNVIVNE